MCCGIWMLHASREERATVMSVSRRGFLVGAAATAVFCSVGGAAYVLSSDGLLVRPPGGQDEASFIAACLRCDRCRSVCPQSCIGLAKLENGLLEARTPQMDYRRGACTFCNRCIEVCPTGALRSFDPQNERIGIAVVSQESCLAWKSPGSCMKCEESCPYGAITIEGGVPVVHESACNGCGVCEYVCPALVLTSAKDGNGRGIVVKVLASVDGNDAGAGNGEGGDLA